MIADELLGAFAEHFTDAAEQSSRYRKRRDKSLRVMGGYNLLQFWRLLPTTAYPRVGSHLHTANVEENRTSKDCSEHLLGRRRQFP